MQVFTSGQSRLPAGKFMTPQFVQPHGGWPLDECETADNLLIIRLVVGGCIYSECTVLPFSIARPHPGFSLYSIALSLSLSHCHQALDLQILFGSISNPCTSISEVNSFESYSVCDSVLNYSYIQNITLPRM